MENLTLKKWELMIRVEVVWKKCENYDNFEHFEQSKKAGDRQSRQRCWWRHNRSVMWYIIDSRFLDKSKKILGSFQALKLSKY